mgnify:CR=1 FL=1
MSAFVDTSLIECNRLQSIEHLSDNTIDRKNSEWSNRLGEALQLNVARENTYRRKSRGPY